MSLERIEVTPFAVIAGDILQHRRSGLLTVAAGPVRRVLYWSQGDLVMNASQDPAESLGHFLVQRGALSAEKAAEVFGNDPNDAVARLHESGLLDHSTRQTLMREWLAGQFLPLFSLDEGTTAFSEDEPIAPDRRIFLSSTAALYVDGVRSITNGLVLRRTLGDLKREIHKARDSRFPLDSLPLNEPELAIVTALTEPTTIEAFLRQFPAQSSLAAKMVGAMLGLGVFSVAAEQRTESLDDTDTQRDLELLAAIGSGDPRSLRTLAFARQLPKLDHYQVLDIPRAAPRSQILAAYEAMKRKHHPSAFPAVMAEPLATIQKRLDEAFNTLGEANRRAAYDRLLQNGSAEGATMEQRVTRRYIAMQNLARAKELMTKSDFYGAIVLLQQAVKFLPDLSEAWFLLGSCQERNPKWRREAAESFQTALSLAPEDTDALIALGDLYRSEGLLSRAQTCYEDVLKIAPENQQANSRLQALKKR